MRFLLALVGLAFVVQSLVAQETPSLISLDFKQEIAELEKPIEQLEQSYKLRLRETSAAAKKDGNLEKILVIDRELASISVVQPKEFAEFSDLQRLRGTFDREKAKRNADRNRKVELVKVEYAKRFGEEISALTRQGNLEAAIKVRKEKETLLNSVKSHVARPLPKNKTELVKYLAGTVWSWDQKSRAKFTEDQKIHGIAIKGDDITWRPYSYTVTDDMKITYSHWEIEFDSSFTKLQTTNLKKKKIAVSDGQLLETDSQ